jgi:hypothetical protein
MLPLNITTGIGSVRVDILSFLSVSSPDPPGMLMSSTIASTGGLRIAAIIACTASNAETVL